MLNAPRHWPGRTPRFWAKAARLRFAALLTAADKLGIQYIRHRAPRPGGDRAARRAHRLPRRGCCTDETLHLPLPQDTLARLLPPLGEFAADVQEMAQDFKVNGTV